MPLGFEESEKRHRQSNRTSAAVRHKLRRMEAIEAYGGVCSVCGAVDWSAFMVVPKDSTRWRDLVPDPPAQGARNKYAWLQRKGYPSTFALVCGAGCRGQLARGG